MKATNYLSGAMLGFAMTVSFTAVQAANAEGIYSLPFNESHPDVQNFPLVMNHFEVTSSGRLIVDYDVPKDLIGREESMRMITSAPLPEDERFFNLHCFRTDTDAMCTKSGSEITCIVKFKNVPVDRSVADDYLTQNYGESPLTEQRKAAVVTFMGGAEIVQGFKLKGGAVGTLSFRIPQ